MKINLLFLLFLPFLSFSQQECTTIYSQQYSDSITTCITNSSCHSSCDGQITVTVFGLNQPYYFEWGSCGLGRGYSY